MQNIPSYKLVFNREDQEMFIEANESEYGVIKVQLVDNGKSIMFETRNNVFIAPRNQCDVPGCLRWDTIVSSTEFDSKCEEHSIPCNDGIDINDKTAVNDLIESINYYACLDHVVIDGKEIHNRDCEGNESCHDSEPLDAHSVVDYVIAYEDEPVDWIIRGEKNYTINNERVFNVDDSVRIVLVNARGAHRGFNPDHRGSNHTSTQLDWHHVYQLRDNTINSLADAFFRIKSHKFNTWYEMLTGVRKIEVVKDVVVIHIGFDHGS